MGRPKGSKNKSSVETVVQQEIALDTASNETVEIPFSPEAPKAKQEKVSPIAPVVNNVSSAVESKVLSMVMDLSMTIHKQSDKTSEMLAQFLSMQSQINTTFQQLFRRIEEVEKAIAQPLKFGVGDADLLRLPSRIVQAPSNGKHLAEVHPFPTPNVVPPQPMCGAGADFSAAPSAAIAAQVTTGLSPVVEKVVTPSSGLATDDMGLL